jgi:hypothetical protein
MNIAMKTTLMPCTLPSSKSFSILVTPQGVRGGSPAHGRRPRLAVGSDQTLRAPARCLGRKRSRLIGIEPEVIDIVIREPEHVA